MQRYFIGGISKSKFPFVILTDTTLIHAGTNAVIKKAIQEYNSKNNLNANNLNTKLFFTPLSNTNNHYSYLTVSYNVIDYHSCVRFNNKNISNEHLKYIEKLFNDKNLDIIDIKKDNIDNRVNSNNLHVEYYLIGARYYLPSISRNISFENLSLTN